MNSTRRENDLSFSSDGKPSGVGSRNDIHTNGPGIIIIAADVNLGDVVVDEYIEIWTSSCGIVVSLAGGTTRQVLSVSAGRSPVHAQDRAV